MADLRTAPQRPRARVGRPSTASMLAGQTAYAARGFLRTPVSTFFTLVFPLTFLVVLSSIYGNAVIDEATGLRLAQFTTPAFAVFGATMACYVSLASALAYARGNGVLKRIRGTPLPPWLHVLGRILAAMGIAALAVVIMVAVGVAFYDVQLIGRNLPALVLTFLIGTASFAAMGIAVAAAAPTPNAATAFANATLILLGFVSGIFAIGELPAWVERVGSMFPLKPFVEAFSDGFNPYIDAAAPDWQGLAIMAVWGLAGALVAQRALTWEPSEAALARRRQAAVPGGEVEVGEAAGGSMAPPVPDPIRARTVHRTGSPSIAAMLGSQVRYSAQQILRDPMSAFFTVIFPVLLLVFFAGVNDPEATYAGLPLAQYLAASFAVYGVATSGLVNLPGAIAEHRATRILKRLRGAPLPPWAYLASRVLATLLFGFATVALVFAAGALFFDVSLPPDRWLAAVLTFVLAIGCFAACGLLLVSVVDAPQAVIAAGLSTLLPLSFISDIFILGVQLPTVLNWIGWFFPLRHAVAAAVTATSGAALDSAFWLHLAVLAAWLAATSLLSWRFFHWEPRPGRSSRNSAAD